MGLQKSFIQDIIIFELNDELYDPHIVRQTPSINYNYRPRISVTTRDTNNRLDMYLYLIEPFVVREQFIDCLDTDCKNEFKVMENLYIDYTDNRIPSLVYMFAQDPYSLISVSDPLLVPIAAITINNEQRTYHRICEVEYEVYEPVSQAGNIKTYLESDACICESPLSELFALMLFYAEFVSTNPFLTLQTK